MWGSIDLNLELWNNIGFGKGIFEWAISIMLLWLLLPAWGMVNNYWMRNIVVKPLLWTLRVIRTIMVLVLGIFGAIYWFIFLKGYQWVFRKFDDKYAYLARLEKWHSDLQRLGDKIHMLRNMFKVQAQTMEAIEGGLLTYDKQQNIEEVLFDSIVPVW